MTENQKLIAQLAQNAGLVVVDTEVDYKVTQEALSLLEDVSNLGYDAEMVVEPLKAANQSTSYHADIVAALLNDDLKQNDRISELKADVERLEEKLDDVETELSNVVSDLADLSRSSLDNLISDIDDIILKVENIDTSY